MIQKWNQGIVPKFPNFHGLQTEQLETFDAVESDTFNIKKMDNDHAQNYRQVGEVRNTLEVSKDKKLYISVNHCDF